MGVWVAFTILVVLSVGFVVSWAWGVSRARAAGRTWAAFADRRGHAFEPGIAGAPGRIVGHVEGREVDIRRSSWESTTILALGATADTEIAVSTDPPVDAPLWGSVTEAEAGFGLRYDGRRVVGVRHGWCEEDGQLDELVDAALRVAARVEGSPRAEAVGRALDRVVEGLVDSGAWRVGSPRVPTPGPEAGAFAARDLAFPEWIQQVFVPRVRERVASRGPWPETSQVAVRAVRENDSGCALSREVIDALTAFDEVAVRGGPMPECEPRSRIVGPVRVRLTREQCLAPVQVDLRIRLTGSWCQVDVQVGTDRCAAQFGSAELRWFAHALTEAEAGRRAYGVTVPEPPGQALVVKRIAVKAAVSPLHLRFGPEDRVHQDAVDHAVRILTDEVRARSTSTVP